MSIVPILLAPDTFDHFYLGGTNITALRNAPAGARRPEEWLGSTVRRWGQGDLGLTAYDGTTLRAAIAADPTTWLGEEHAERFGANPAVLVKLLDAGQRLPVHVHPTRLFAQRHLNCPFGKSEAWVILEGERSNGTVFVGTTRPVAQDEWAELIDAQATDAMLELLVPIDVRPGDAVFVPSGTPHSIGEGTFVLEVQEPTDFSVLMEWKGFALDGTVDGHLGLGFDTALETVRRDAFDADAIDRITARHRADGNAHQTRRRSLLPEIADPYFRAWDLTATAGSPVELPDGFGIMVITDGTGTLRTAGHPTEVRRGDALVVPADATARVLDGDVRSILAQGPAHDAPAPIEWDSPEVRG